MVHFSNDSRNNSNTGLINNQEIQARIQVEVDTFNQHYGGFEQIKRYTLLDHEFSVEEGELTPTLKLKRKIVLEKYKDLFRFVVPIQERMEEQVKDFFNPDFEIYSELWEIVKWYYPHLQEPHVDFIDPDFDISSIDIDSVPEQCKYFFDEKNISEYKRLFTNKIYTSMLYLNDNFEGGELFFPQHNEYSIKPEAGMLLVFSGDINTMHGIRQIESGNRYTHTTFWTKDLYKSSLVAIDKKKNKFNINTIID